MFQNNFLKFRLLTIYRTIIFFLDILLHKRYEIRLVITLEPIQCIECKYTFSTFVFTALISVFETRPCMRLMGCREELYLLLIGTVVAAAAVADQNEYRFVPNNGPLEKCNDCTKIWLFN